MLMLLENKLYIVSQYGALHALREGIAILLCDWGTVKMKAEMVKATRGLVHPCEPSIQNEIFHHCPQIELTSRFWIPSITRAHELIVKIWLQGSADPAKQNALASHLEYVRR